MIENRELYETPSVLILSGDRVFEQHRGQEASERKKPQLGVVRAQK
ncbi:MAG: hypothetical protein AAFP04_13130 [Myxococcota bacterium]